MKIIGLTGGIASGKSTASSILKKFGATIIDADILARKVVEKGQPTLEKILMEFGEKVIKEDGTLDRKALGEIVFADKKKIKVLNKIIHPQINKLTRDMFIAEKSKGKQKIIYDCPLLIEENLMYLVDEIWLIYVDEKTQLRRLMERDNFTKEQAMKRIRNQLPLRDKKVYADVLIENSGKVSDLENKLKVHWYD